CSYPAIVPLIRQRISSYTSFSVNGSATAGSSPLSLHDALPILQSPKLGRLLIFDATDDMTPVGDLPAPEQGSLALVVAGDNGSLMRMPVTPPDSNHMERQAEMTLNANGSITASVHERSIGQAAAGERRLFRKVSRHEYTQ